MSVINCNSSGEGLAGCFVLVLVIVLAPFLLMWVWSLFAPSIFGLPYLTWVEAWALGMFGYLMFQSKPDGNSSK